MRDPAFPWWSGLRARLLLLVALAVLPSLGLLLYAAGREREAARTEARQEALRLARLTAAHQEQLISGARQLLTALGRLPMVRRREIEAANEVFSDLLRQYPVYENLGAAKPDGELFASGLPFTPPLSVADRSWFLRAKEEGIFAAGDYQIGQLRKEPVLYLGQPVLNEKGGAEAYLFAALHLSEVQRILEGLQIPPETVLTIVDRNGTVLARRPETRVWAGRRMRDLPLVRTMLSGRTEILEMEGVDGTRRLYGVSPIGGADRPFFFVAVGIPPRIAFEKADRVLRRNILALGGGTLLALAVAWIGGRWALLRQTEALLAATRRMQGGDLGARSGIRARGELGELGRAFDEMSASVSASQASLRDNEERMRLIVENALDAVVAIDEDGKITEWSRRAEATFGWTREEALGRLLTETIIPPRYREAHRQGLARYLRTGEGPVLGRRIEIEGLKRDGTELSVELSISPFRSGGRTCFSAFLRDLTERRRAEERFRLAVESAPSAMLMVDAEGRITLVNVQLERLFGYPRAELIGQSVEKLIPDRFRAGHPAYRNAFFADPKARPMGAGRDLSGLRRDGSEIPIEIGLQPIETADGPQVLASIIDITERKRAQERFRLAVEAAPNAMLMVDAAGRITLVNAQVERLFGHPRAELIGQAVEKLIPDRFRAGHPTYRDAFFADPKARPMGAGRDLYGLRRDGSEIPIEIGLQPIETPEGPRVLASIIDITERKRAQEQMARMNAELERRVAERTAALEAANRELEAFSYSVSHDLRAPLRAIDGFSQALIEDSAERLDPQGKGHLQRVRAAAQRMGELIDGVLTLSRVSRAELRREEVDLSAMAASVAEEIRAADPARKAKITIEPGMKARGDARLLRSVLENLLGNAWKFTRGRPQAAIACGRLMQGKGEGAEAAFFVRDNGAGFDMAYADKLFGTFQRLHRPEEFEGHGVGLATVKRIVSRHGGRAWAEGKPGGGATFFFTLPR